MPNKTVNDSSIVREGLRAPDFKLVADNGKMTSLSDFRGKPLVLYFYPKDSTPGCTIQAQDFSANIAKFRKLGAEVVGVSKDNTASHCKFRDKFDLHIPLLSDPALVTHRAYGVYGEKMMYGKKILGTIRSTFVIDPAGKIAHVIRGVKVKGHADAVLALLAGAVPAVATTSKSSAARKTVTKEPAAKKTATRKK